jgi:hypothetical protein
VGNCAIMVRVECLAQCRVNFAGSKVISVNIIDRVVEGLDLLGTVLQLCRYCSPGTLEDCETTLRNGSDREAMFLAIFWLENYEEESQWTMEDSAEEWDPKVSELLDRFFR